HYFSQFYLHLHHFPTRRSSDLEPNPPTNDDLIGAFSKIKAGVIHSIIDNNLTEDETEKLIDDIEVKIENLEDELEDNRVNDTCLDRRRTRLNSSHVSISYAVFY